jgi:hypothetical protein
VQTFWTYWLVAIALSFAIAEALGMYRFGTPGTLSYFMTSLGQKWPPLLVVYGMLFGGLAVHFWWARSY